jgi:ATP-dependent protease ClpP protease subunit
MTTRLALLARHTRRLALSTLPNCRPAARVDARVPWYTIRNADDGAERVIVSLDGEIGWDVESSDFARELRAITAPNIDLHINSPGGSAWDGYAIYNALVTHPATITAHIVGVAASAASFIAMAGTEVVAYRPSEMMIHDAAGWVDVWGILNPADLARVVGALTELKGALDQTSDEIAAIYARKAGADHGTAADWRTRMQATTWYTPDTALAAGLVDRIDGDDIDSPAPGETGATDGASASAAWDWARARDRARARARAY